MAMSGESIWFKSLLACCAAPSPGVLVTAPERIPAIVVMGIPVTKCNTTAMPTLIMITVNTNILSDNPPLRKEAKKLGRLEEHTSELQSRQYLVCRLLLEKKKQTKKIHKK